MFWQGLTLFLTCFDTFLTIMAFFDWQIVRWTNRPILYNMFWHFFDMFWHFFWQFFDRQTDIQNLDVEAPARSLIKKVGLYLQNQNWYSTSVGQKNVFNMTPTSKTVSKGPQKSKKNGPKKSCIKNKKIGLYF